MIDLKIQIPDGFLEEEVRCDYLVTSHMKEVWAVMLDLLVEFDRVCKTYGLKYFASGGTLLGAVRHRGFIPWDDDIDLMMLREDYDKLLEIGPREFRNPFFFQSKFTDPSANDLLVKIRNSETTSLFKAEKKCALPYNKGIFIDVFPLDNVPDNQIVRRNYFEVLEAKRQMIIKYGRTIGIYSASENTISMLIKNTLYHLLKWRRNVCINNYLQLIAEYESLCAKYSGENTEFVASFVYGPKENLFRSKSDLIDCMDFDFEFVKVPVCSGYHHYLTDAFGDYMKFVRGTSWHSELFFDTNNGYKDYR